MYDNKREKITVETIVGKTVGIVWELWTDPAHIMRWNNASHDWQTTYAENDLSIGGRFLSRMEAKDGSTGFDFSGKYDFIDLYSRKIVGWSMSNNMKAELVNDALLMAIWARKPAKGLVWHTDRGSQYAADSHLAIIKQHHIVQSMSRKGNCWDNAVAASFFHTLKVELIHRIKFRTRDEAKRRIFEYVEMYYNRRRAHSTLGNLSPFEYEKQAI